MSNDGFRLSLRVTPNRSYVVQRSSDLVAWQDWFSTYCTNEPMEVVDQAAVSQAFRFYRARIGGPVQP